MAATLFLPFDGSLAGESPGGAVAATMVGSASYVPGMLPGSQAIVASTGNYATYPTAGLFTSERGALATRIDHVTLIASTTQAFLSVGSAAVAGEQYMGVSTFGANVWVHQRNGTGTASNTNIGAYPPGFFTVYMDWDGTTVRARRSGGTLTTITRPTPSATTPDTLAVGAYANGSLSSHGSHDAVLTFDAPLSAIQIDALFDESRAWSLDMFATRRIFPILKVGSQQHIGPLRAGKA